MQNNLSKAPLCFLAGSALILDREVSVQRAVSTQTGAAAVPSFSQWHCQPCHRVKWSLAVTSSAESKLIYSLKTSRTKQPPAIVSLPVCGRRWD